MTSGSKKNKKLLVANWKMNPGSLNRAEKIFHQAAEKTKGLKNTKVVICPPFLYLSRLSRNPAEHISLGAQNCFWENKGAYTGEISPAMLEKTGSSHVILGHSERRNLLSETDEMIFKKFKAALGAGLTPILCIGETEKQYKEQRTKEVLEAQLKFVLKDSGQKTRFVLAYEPRWAIGTGVTPAPDQAGETAEMIIKKVGRKVPILYGGSVDSKNVSSFIRTGFNGVLVGGGSLDAEEFAKIGEIVDNS